ncbi:MAG: ABC transporter ATP-binding protein, partial [bacterium]
FMTTHYMDEAEHCDRIGVIDHGELVALDTPGALKRSVGGDIIALKSARPEALAAALWEQFGSPARLADGQVVVEREGGAEFVPQVVSAFPGLIDSVTVQPPTLDDVFLKLTGHAIREESASNVDRLRTMARVWRRH